MYGITTKWEVQIKLCARSHRSSKKTNSLSDYHRQSQISLSTETSNTFQKLWRRSQESHYIHKQPVYAALKLKTKILKQKSPSTEYIAFCEVITNNNGLISTILDYEVVLFSKATNFAICSRIRPKLTLMNTFTFKYILGFIFQGRNSAGKMMIFKSYSIVIMSTRIPLCKNYDNTIGGEKWRWTSWNS